MKHKNTVNILVFLIGIAAIAAASLGIFSDGGSGTYMHESVRGEMVTIYGKGVYKHMSADVAPQGIAQDYVTLLLCVPMLLFSLFRTRQGSLKGRFLLAGTLGYFLVTYLFYLVMGMYNVLFLGYVFLLGTSFFAFSMVMLSFEPKRLGDYFSSSAPVKFSGGFLVFNSLAIGLLWLGVVVPPLLDGSIIPKEVEHYTTLIVQGLDLAILLPLAFLSGVLLIRKRPFGYLLGPVYLVFLSLLMTALTAKVIAMGLLGQPIIPAVFIIPSFALVSAVCTVLMMRSIREPD